MTIYERETFSLNPAGFDLGPSWAKSAAAGSSVNEDFATPGSLGSGFAECLRVINTAGDGVSLGVVYAARAISSRRDQNVYTFLTELTAESLADNQDVFNVYMTDVSGATVLMIGDWIQLSGSLFYRMGSYASGVYVQLGPVFPVSLSTPYKIRLRVDIKNLIYGFSFNDGPEAFQNITDATRQSLQMGLVALGNLSFGASVNAATQDFGYAYVGDPAFIGEPRVLPYPRWVMGELG